MKINEILIIVGLIFLVMIVFFIFSSKVARKQITIIAEDGKKTNVDAEIAKSIPDQMKGLMGRDKIGEKEGMLFVFSTQRKQIFWMMNTTIPLEALHFSENGELVDIIKMEPCKSIMNCPQYIPKAEAKYVLEVNQGFSQENKIEIGKSKLKTEEIDKK
jgi:uncharacterized membrane protein (UPF0127 family)